MTTIIQMIPMILDGTPPNPEMTVPVMIAAVMIAGRAMEISTGPAMMVNLVTEISMAPIAIQVMEISSTLVLTPEMMAGIVAGIAATAAGIVEMTGTAVAGIAATVAGMVEMTGDDR